jgi:hypothetical protein
MHTRQMIPRLGCKSPQNDCRAIIIICQEEENLGVNFRRSGDHFGAPQCRLLRRRTPPFAKGAKDGAPRSELNKRVAPSALTE